MGKLFLRSKEKTKAQAMVEFALVLPILLMMLYGMMEVGRLLFIYASTVTAARQAARYGSATGIGPNGVPYYQDCKGIIGAANRLGFINRFSSITVVYDNGVEAADGAPVRISDPDPTCESQTFIDAANGDRIKVEVTTWFQPIVPLVPLQAFRITSASERTILVSVDIAVTGLPPDFGGTGGVASLAMTANVPEPYTYDTLDEEIIFTYTITNLGDNTLAGPFLVFDPSGKMNIVCLNPPAEIIPLGTYSCTATYYVSQADLDAGTLTAIGQTGALQPPPLVFTAIQNGDFALTKTPNKLSTVNQTPGDLVYTYELVNNGNVTLTLDSIKDISNGTLTSLSRADCKVNGASLSSVNFKFSPPTSDLAVDINKAKVVCTLPHTVSDEEIAAGSITNTVTAVASYNNISSGSQTITKEATRVVKTTPIFLSVTGELITGSAPYTSEQIKYTFTVTNNGTSTLTLNSITLDTVLDSFTGKGTLPVVSCGGLPLTITAGATITCPVVIYNVVPADLNNIDPVTGVGIPVSIKATATAGIYKSTTELYSVDVYRYPSLDVITATTIPPSTVSPAVTTTVNTNVSYKYTIRNTGNVTLWPPLGGFVVTDTKVSDIVCDTPNAAILAGGTKECTSSRYITQQDIDDGSVIGVVGVSATFGITTYPAPPAKSLAITSTIARLKLEITTPLPSVAGAGVNIVYTYTVTNIGNEPLSTVADSTPYDFTTGLLKGSTPVCTDTILEIGESTTCTGTYKTTNADKGTDVVNTTAAKASTAASLLVVSDPATISVAVTTPIFCSVNHGVLSPSPLGMTITNNNDFSIDIDSIQIWFNDNPTNQQITQLTLGGGILWQKTNVGMPGYIDFTTSMYTGNYTIPPNTTYLLSVTGWKSDPYNPLPPAEKIMVSFTDTNCQDMDSTALVVLPSTDMDITKTNSATSVDIGGNTTYTIRVTNHGPSSITTSKLSDAVQPGLSKTTISCSSTPGQCVSAPSKSQLESGNFTLPTITSGQFYEIKVTANITATTGSVSNTATITLPGGTTDSVPGNNSTTDTDTVIAPVADLGISKDDGTLTIDSGLDTIYTIRVTNNAGSTITGAKLADPAKIGLSKVSVACSSTPGLCVTAPTVTQLESGTFALPPLAASQFYEIKVKATVTAAGGGSVENIATITMPTTSSNPTDNVPANNSATDINAVTTPSADFEIAKTDGTTSVNAGGNTTYTILVTNHGPAAVKDVFLSDPAVIGLSKTSVSCSGTPGKCSIPPSVTDLQSGTFKLPLLASGETYEITVATTVTATSGDVENIATIAVPVTANDPGAYPNTATDTDTVTPSANLVMTKTNGVTSVTSGSPTTYTIRVTNNGLSTVTDAVLTDTPTGVSITSIACSGTPGKCTALTTPSSTTLQSGYTLPSLASGEHYEIAVTANVTATSGSVSNNATVASASVLDPTPANNTVTDTDPVVLVANLKVEKTNGVTTLSTGGSTTYTLRVTNNGPSTVTDATLTDTPTGVSISSVACSGTPGKCTGPTTPTGGTLQSGYVLPSLASGEYYEIVVGANVTATSGSVSNKAVIASSATDNTPADNTVTDTDTLLVADLSITKTDNATFYLSSGTVTYYVTVTNISGVTINNATVTDIKPSQISTWAWACTPAATGGATGCTAAASSSANFSDSINLPVGGTINYTVTANIIANPTGYLANKATVALPLGYSDPVASNNEATDPRDTPACTFANLVFTKVVISGSVSPRSVTWSITNNMGIPLPITSIAATWTNAGVPTTKSQLASFGFNNGLTLTPGTALPATSSPYTRLTGILATGTTNFTLSFTGISPAGLTLKVIFGTEATTPTSINHGTNCTHTSSTSAP